MSGPDRIWAWPWAVNPRMGQWSAEREIGGKGMGYIRRDPAVLAALPEVQALIAGACDRFRGNLRETFDAMCAMRDAINEHIPMPSLESDLLHGPENSVFCATVAESVIDAIAARDALIAEAVAKEREACARLVDCGCDKRQKAAVIEAKTSAERARACGQYNCGAEDADAIRKRGEGKG